jgi:hypothetical protein
MSGRAPRVLMTAGLLALTACAGTPPRLTAGARGADIPRPPLVSDANPAALNQATDAPAPKP